MSRVDQSILASWTVTYLASLKPDGHIIVPDNSPLTTEEIVEALEAVAEHENYKRQTVSVPNRDGSRTILRWDGEKAVVEPDVVQDEPHERTMPDGVAVFMDDDMDIPTTEEEDDGEASTSGSEAPGDDS